MDISVEIALFFQPLPSELGCSQKTLLFLNRITISSISRYIHTQKKLKTRIQTDTCMPMFIEALFTIVKKWKKRISFKEWMDSKIPCNWLLVIKRNEILIYILQHRWTLKTYRETSQTQKVKYWWFCLYEVLRIIEFLETERIKVAKSERREEMELVFNGYRVSVWDDEKVLEMYTGECCK